MAADPPEVIEVIDTVRRFYRALGQDDASAVASMVTEMTSVDSRDPTLAQWGRARVGLDQAACRAIADDFDAALVRIYRDPIGNYRVVHRTASRKRATLAVLREDNRWRIGIINETRLGRLTHPSWRDRKI